MMWTLMKLALFLLAMGFASALPTNGTKSVKSTLLEQEQDGEQNLSPVENTNNNFLDGLVEVKEDEIPEGTSVYVLEEEPQLAIDGETMDTANNIVFRPLFHYRNKQAAKLARRRSSAARRRYYVSRRPYRQAYYNYYPRYRRYGYY